MCSSIEILLYQEGKRLFIQINDSGVGINIAKLEHIQFDAKHHIGIKNISDRLKHYYHNRAELELTRISEEGGTKVTLSFPVKFKGAGNVQAAHS